MSLPATRPDFDDIVAGTFNKKTGSRSMIDCLLDQLEESDPVNHAKVLAALQRPHKELSNVRLATALSSLSGQRFNQQHVSRWRLANA